MNQCPICHKPFKRLYISGDNDRIYIHRERRLKELSEEMGIPVTEIVEGCQEYNKTDCVSNPNK